MVLEPLVREHAFLVFEPLREPRLYQFIPENPPVSVQELEARYSALARRTSPDGREGWLNWVARLSEAQKYVGIFQSTIHPDLTADIAYTVFLDFWRTGYGKEGCRRVLEYLFSKGVTVVGARVDTRNSSSIRLLESIGFRRCGLLSNADYFKGGKSDEFEYEITEGQLL